MPISERHQPIRINRSRITSQWEIKHWKVLPLNSDLNIFKSISFWPRRAAWGLRETSSSSHRGPYSERGLSLANLKTKNKSGLIQTFQTWKQPKPTQFWFGANFSIISTFDKNLENATFLKKCTFDKNESLFFCKNINLCLIDSVGTRGWVILTWRDDSRFMNY